MAQVPVDNEHPALLDGQGLGQVNSDECLSAAGVERCGHQDIRPAVIAGHELQVGAQDPESLVDNVPAALLDHYSDILVFSVEMRNGEQFLFLSGIERKLSYKGYSELLYILPPPHPRIGSLHYKESTHRDEQADDQCYQHDLRRHRCGRSHLSRRRGDKPCIVCGERLGKLVLLALLQQEEV